MKRAAAPSKTNNSNNAIINMNHNSNHINEACSSLSGAPLPLYRTYPNPNQHYHQQREQKQMQQPHHTRAVDMCSLVSPPTPERPSIYAFSSASTLKHGNTTVEPSSQPNGKRQHYSEQQKKKTVSFAPTATVQPINIPKASDMSHEEKEIIWYLGNDYNRFKNNAASDGGVKIMRHVTTKEEQNSCHFVCIGNFDGKCDKDTSSSSNDGSNHSSDAATAGSSRSSPSGKFYNEHEYNDYIKENGYEVCKRGLGYHFSRIRKHNRLMTRNAVVAWQKCMQKESNQQSMAKVVLKKMQTMPNSSSSNTFLPMKLQQTQSIVLASVSSKCSRVSREEALWRGDIDFRVAYPERFCSSLGAIDNMQSKRSSSSGANDSASKRRRGNGCAYFSEADWNTPGKESAACYTYTEV